MLHYVDLIYFIFDMDSWLLVFFFLLNVIELSLCTQQKQRYFVYVCRSDIAQLRTLLLFVVTLLQMYSFLSIFVHTLYMYSLLLVLFRCTHVLHIVVHMLYIVFLIIYVYLV